LDVATLGPEILVTMPFAGLGGLVENGPKGFFQSSLDQAWKLIDDRMARLFSDVADKAGISEIVSKVTSAILLPNGPHKVGSEEGQAPARSGGYTQKDIDSALSEAISTSRAIERMKVPESDHGLYYTPSGSVVQRDFFNAQRSMAADIHRIREKLETMKLDLSELSI